MHLKRFVKLRKLEHWQLRQLAFKLPKGLVTRLYTTFGIAIFLTNWQGPYNFRKIMNEVVVVVGSAKQQPKLFVGLEPLSFFD